MVTSWYSFEPKQQTEAGVLLQPFLEAQHAGRGTYMWNWYVCVCVWVCVSRILRQFSVARQCVRHCAAHARLLHRTIHFDVRLKESPR